MDERTECWTNKQTDRLTDRRVCTGIHVHTCMDACAQTHIHTDACKHTHTHACTCAGARTQMYTLELVPLRNKHAFEHNGHKDLLKQVVPLCMDTCIDM